jgi:hypothetical protein
MFRIDSICTLLRSDLFDAMAGKLFKLKLVANRASRRLLVRKLAKRVFLVPSIFEMTTSGMKLDRSPYKRRGEPLS